MADPVIVQSSDPGAPQLTGEIGSMRAVLKHALPLIGWTEEFDDAANDTVVFRNDPVSGTGDYLRIDDGAPVDARVCTLSSFATMTDVDTGTDQIGDANVKWYKSQTANATTRPWVIIGDSKSFIIGIDTASNGSACAYYCGDIDSPKVNDTGRFCLNGSLNTSFSNTATAGGFINVSSSSDEFRQLRYSYDTVETGVNVEIERTNDDSGSDNSQPGVQGPASPLSGSVVTYSACLRADSGGENGAYRGSMRGLSLPTSNVISGLSQMVSTATGVISPSGSVDFWAIRCKFRLVNTTGWGELVIYVSQSDWG